MVEVEPRSPEQLGDDGLCHEQGESPIRRDTVERTAAELTAASSEATRTLLALQKDAIPPTVRLGATKAILEIGMNAREVAELEVQLRELEQQVKALDRDRATFGYRPGRASGEALEHLL